MRKNGWNFCIFEKRNIMSRQELLDLTIDKIKKLPDVKIREINDFAEFLLNKLDDTIILEGIQKMTSDAKTFSYLQDEEDLYSVNDLKERYI
jgi:hypothetical protein